MELGAYLKNVAAATERGLEAALPAASHPPKRLHQAMRYAVFSGGKRIRPALVFASCQAVGGRERDAVPAALAVELIHNYSLIHDDLPCMDDDDTRRGKPTCHKKFGEDTAVLAGDALLTLAFRVFADGVRRLPAVQVKRRMEACGVMAVAAGSEGMAGGQSMDMIWRDREADLPTLEAINIRKTGALLAAGVTCGAILGGAPPSKRAALSRFGRVIGLLFQIVDDILDSEGYARLIGAPEARREADRLLERALRELRPFGHQAEALRAIAGFIHSRDF